MPEREAIRGVYNTHYGKEAEIGADSNAGGRMSSDDTRGPNDQNGTEGHDEQPQSPPQTPQEEEPKLGPLTADEFSRVLDRLDELGLTWTADPIPRLKAKTPDLAEALGSPEVAEIQRKYPYLPRDVSFVVFSAFTGSPIPHSVTGDETEAEKKRDFLRDRLFSADFRSEFFFRHAIKVPTFSFIDWEVVLKTFENNVKEIPGIPYALLLLHFSDPSSYESDEAPDTKTVAVNASLVDKLIESLTEVRDSLKQAHIITDELAKVKYFRGDNSD